MSYVEFKIGYYNKAKEKAFIKKLINVIGIPNFFICSLISLLKIIY